MRSRRIQKKRDDKKMAALKKKLEKAKGKSGKGKISKALKKARCFDGTPPTAPHLRVGPH